MADRDCNPGPPAARRDRNRGSGCFEPDRLTRSSCTVGDGSNSRLNGRECGHQERDSPHTITGWPCGMQRVTAIRSAPSGSSWQGWCRLGRSPATVDPNVTTESPVVWPGQERDGRRKSVFGFAVLDVNRPGDHRRPHIRYVGRAQPSSCRTTPRQRASRS
jgi:hypothetical protein